MKIAIGSHSPSKVSAARAILQQAFPAAEITAVGVESGVTAMPASMEEAIRGALHRARAAREQAGADLGVGIEGGVETTPHGVFLTAWAAVIDAAGRRGLGSGPRIALPESVAVRLRGGEELGPLVDQVAGVRDAHESLGAIGWLTRGLVTREEAHRHAVAAALAPFLPGRP